MRLASLLRAAAAEATEATAAAPKAAKTRAPRVRWPVTKTGESRANLTLEQALYLAKEAGFWTTREVQLQIVRSPPFSLREKPFLLENFFEVSDYPEEAQRSNADAEASSLQQGTSSDKPPEAIEAHSSDSVNPVIHQAIEKYFRPDLASKFFHRGDEWLSRSEGRGTRKRAAAHAVLVRGTGLFRVNGESDLFARWPHIYHRFDVCQPFKLTGTAGVYDVFVEVRGGGLSGQAGAARLAVARALLQANPTCHDALQQGFCLLEDARQRMSKMPGKKGSRASFPWNKR